ncbi:predicted protein [Micromonas commoda]|uniref:Uncharacterized protein n=1 Tax=Micromonas commoda (strain RCC299 / NOUM17 / CCMP2709) TaxID=296587 RepID=C1EJI8_MICCC|nr:predicted protein [Micromonas commoda]ACO68239.1 predicted protein [Micromonas commoda]|eukprot:XP_002506981.1 predicted protein [Micromonas commoda]
MGAFAVPREIWRKRAGIFDKLQRNEGKSQYLSKLLHDWMFRWALPLNACSRAISEMAV